MVPTGNPNAPREEGEDGGVALVPLLCQVLSQSESDGKASTTDVVLPQEDDSARIMEVQMAAEEGPIIPMVSFRFCVGKDIIVVG